MSTSKFLFLPAHLLLMAVLFPPSVTLAQSIEMPVDHGTTPAQPAGGSFVTVGSDAAACDFTDLQAAIDLVPSGTEIRLSSGLSHSGRSYLVNQFSLTIRGGFSSCTSPLPAGQTTINVAGNNGAVITVANDVSDQAANRTVNLENLRLRGAEGVLGSGLVVFGVAGKLQVNLRNVEVLENNRLNTGTGGAGILLQTTGLSSINSLSPMLTIDNDSIISDNSTTGDGGGIYLNCAGQGTIGNVTILRMGSAVVRGNSANSGGGIAVNRCRNNFVYGGGAIEFLVPRAGFLNNSASSGGAVAVLGGGELVMRAVEFDGFGDASQAVLIATNEASGGGGAAYVSGTDSRLLLEDAYLFDNSAKNGGGIGLANGGRVDVLRLPGSGRCLPVERALLTAFYPPCSVFEGNFASEEGGALAITGNAIVVMSQTFLRENAAANGGAVLRSTNSLPSETQPSPQVRMEGVVISGNRGNLIENAAALDVFDLRADIGLDLIHSTVVDNQANALIRASARADRETRINVFSSILEHGNPLVERSDPIGSDMQIRFDCVIANKPAAELDVDNATVYSQIDPRFVNRSNSDYRLREESPAIDYCDMGLAQPQFEDIDGNPRGELWLGAPPITPPTQIPGGRFDLGAYEAQPDRIFSDRFQ